MDAAPVLGRIVKALHDCGLEAILIGNAAAALQGAPVTTLDFDFMFRKTPTNLRKLKTLAQSLDAVVFKPFYPASDLYRLLQEDTGVQVDFMPRLHGVKSFESLRSRATQVSFDGFSVWVAGLEDIIRSKRAAGRPKDEAVLPILETTRDEQGKGKKG